MLQAANDISNRWLRDLHGGIFLEEGCISNNCKPLFNCILADFLSATSSSLSLACLFLWCILFVSLNDKIIPAQEQWLCARFCVCPSSTKIVYPSNFIHHVSCCFAAHISSYNCLCFISWGRKCPCQEGAHCARLTLHYLTTINNNHNTGIHFSVPL